MDEDLKEEFSNNETNNENLQKNLKQLKHSQGAYIGHITKTINKIEKFIIDKEHIEQMKYLEEQLEKHIQKLKIVIDKYCDILESPEQHDIMNECFLEQNACILKILSILVLVVKTSTRISEILPLHSGIIVVLSNK